MICVNYIFADIMVALGRDPYHAQITEGLFLVFLLVPLVAAAPLLLARWAEWKRAENARRTAARRRIAHRMGKAVR